MIGAHSFAVRGLISSLQMVYPVFPKSGQEMKGLGDDSRPTHKGRHTMDGGLASSDGFPVYAPQSCSSTTQTDHTKRQATHKQTQIRKQIFKLHFASIIL